MPALLEPVSYILRWGPDLERKGSKYEFAATVVVEGEVALIKGAAGRLTPGAWREIKSALNQIGVTTARWERFTTSERTVEAR